VATTKYLGGPYKGFRFVARYNTTIHPFVTLDKNIRTMQDMKGKRVFEGRKHGMRWLDTEKIFIEAGIRDTLKVSHGAFGGGARALADGLVDVAVQIGVAPVVPTEFTPLATLQRLMASKKVYFVSYDKEAFERAVEKYGLWVWPMTVPPKVMGPLQTQPVVAKYEALGLMADKSVDDKVIYEVLRILDTYSGKLKEFHAEGKWVKRENLGISGCHPLEEYHPGAAKYFKEHGIRMSVRP
jgi:TRAP-type uncharacterized transport system substrate-binding protein